MTTNSQSKTKKQIQIKHIPNVFKMARIRSNWNGDWITLWVEYTPRDYSITFERAKAAVNSPWYFFGPNSEDNLTETIWDAER